MHEAVPAQEEGATAGQEMMEEAAEAENEMGQGGLEGAGKQATKQVERAMDVAE